MARPNGTSTQAARLANADRRASLLRRSARSDQSAAARAVGGPGARVSMGAGMTEDFRDRIPRQPRRARFRAR
ncbi:hypothetical protein MRA01_14550 [Methylobacterium radiotolerans]|nr:hypothetical protein MRA01_14550 [Methylobacterium radiotolerans]